jgi:hypothetical protein
MPLGEGRRESWWCHCPSRQLARDASGYLDKRDTRDTLTRAIRLCPTRWAARSFAAARISASVRANVTPFPRGT